MNSLLTSSRPLKLVTSDEGAELQKKFCDEATKKPDKKEPGIGGNIRKKIFGGWGTENWGYSCTTKPRRN